MIDVFQLSTIQQDFRPKINRPPKEKCAGTLWNQAPDHPARSTTTVFDQLRKSLRFDSIEMVSKIEKANKVEIGG
jgi:hypothetical protein